MLDKTLQPKAGLISNEGRGFKILPQQAIFYETKAGRGSKLAYFPQVKK